MGSLLVHGWDRINNLSFYSLLALSTHKNVKCYPTMTKSLGGGAGIIKVSKEVHDADKTSPQRPQGCYRLVPKFRLSRNLFLEG